MKQEAVLKQADGKLPRVDTIYFLIYGGVLVWLLLGLLRIPSTRSLAIYLLYVASFSCAGYALFRIHPFRRKFSVLRTGSLSLRWIKAAVVIGALAFPLLHWVQLGGVPLLQALGASSHLDAILVRQRIFEGAHAFWRYGASMNILSVLPFLVLLTLVRKSRWFWPLSLFALVYAASLLQKSHVIVVFLPAILYALGTKNFRLAMKLGVLSMLAVYVLLMGSNPSLRPTWGALLPPAVAATLPSGSEGPSREIWTAYGSRLEAGIPGKFLPGALKFTGENTVYLKPADDWWDLGYSDFSLEFWAFPTQQPKPGKLETLFWNGPEEQEYYGAMRVFHGTRENGIPYVAFATYDKSGRFSTSFGTRPDIKLNLNEWNHVFIGRKGRTIYIGVNGAMDWSSGEIADLTLPEGLTRIVQFGGQFGAEPRAESDEFFNGYLDEIVFAKGVVKYQSDYGVPRHPASVKTLQFDDVKKFEKPLLVLMREPAWLQELLPSWFRSLLHRVIFVPGEVVAQWFAIIPSEIPFAHGCGYRPLAAVLGCEHVNFPQLVYLEYNRYLAEKGVFGTMNAASFMEDYANFGLLGIFISGVVLAGMLYLLGVVFAGRRLVGVALNAVPLLYLSSGALLIQLLSGGWLATLLLYAIFYHDFDNGSEGKVCAV